jgi:hypothetical protein
VQEQQRRRILRPALVDVQAGVADVEEHAPSLSGGRPTLTNSRMCRDKTLDRAWLGRRPAGW